MKLTLLGSLSVAFLLSSATALADVPPPDQCLTAGAACNNAPPDYASPGICTESTCTKGGPDGSTEYPCTLCMAGSAGSGGSSGSAGSGAGGSAGSSAGSGGSSSGGDDDDGGCSVRARTTGSLSLAALALALGAAALGRRRQR